MKIRQVGAELLRADKWTDRRDDAKSSFSQFCYEPKNPTLFERSAIYSYRMSR
jgi:hypothetical protein